MADNVSAEKVSAELFNAVLNRMNITWEPDDKLKNNIQEAIREAHSYLCSIAGNDTLSFDDGEKRTLLIACTWYIIENKRAEFSQEYSGDLLMLRLEEGFGCGKETEDAV